jgi:glycosyltransferase involved in cell wall biosynthesis
MGDPFVSVIIPTLNEEKYIQVALNALKNQDYKGKYEIIISDGGSKDSTLKIARKYADKIVVTKNKGPASGRNAGAKAASGDILLFIDADTLLLFNGLTEIVKAFKNGVIVGATCPVIPLSHQAKDFAIYWFYTQFAKTSIKFKRVHIAGICCAYKKKAFEEAGGFDEGLIFSEDMDFSRRISKLGDVAFTDKTIALTSTRRFERWGRTRGAGKYLAFYLNYLLRGKSVALKYFKPIR